MEARNGSGGRWRDEGALGRGVAYAVRATATRGRRRGHAAAMFCAGQPLCRSIQLVRNAMAEPDNAFSN